jgi:hypothetical protein
LCRGESVLVSKPSRICSTSSSLRPSLRAPSKRMALQIVQSIVRALRMRASSFVAWSTMPWLQSVP